MPRFELTSSRSISETSRPRNEGSRPWTLSSDSMPTSPSTLASFGGVLRKSGGLSQITNRLTVGIGSFRTVKNQEVSGTRARKGHGNHTWAVSTYHATKSNIDEFVQRVH